MYVTSKARKLCAMTSVSLPMPQSLVKDRRGIAMIEMAFMLPMLLVLSIGGMELANLMLAHAKVSNTALAVADNASRIAAGSGLSLPQVREVDINDVFYGAEHSAGTMDFQHRGRIVLSSLELNDDGGQTIKWQRCYGSLNIVSAYGPQGTGAKGKSFAGMGPVGREVKAGQRNPIMFAEVSYNYEPLMFNALPTDWTRIDYEASFAVRDDRDTTQVYQTVPAATQMLCPAGIRRNSASDPLKTSTAPSPLTRFIKSLP